MLVPRLVLYVGHVLVLHVRASAAAGAVCWPRASAACTCKCHLLVLYVGHVLVQLLVLHGVSCWCWKLANVLYLTANMLNLTLLLPLLISAIAATAHLCRCCHCSSLPWLPLLTAASAAQP